MKVSVYATVNYSYEVDVPDGEEDLISYCDCEDPVFQSLCKVLDKGRVEYDAEITSIVDSKTGDILA